MSNIIYIMGKSASGKDTVYKRVKDKMELNTYILYTTRPMREGEQDGVDYYYVSEGQMAKFAKEGRVIESRTYQTVKGPWTYATIEDEQLAQSGDIITVGTLESYQKIKDYYKDKKGTKVIPVYITIDEEERMHRALNREATQGKPNYEEVKRRMLADNIDFSEENLKQCGITEKVTFINDDLERCINEIVQYIENSRDFKEKYKVNIEPVETKQIMAIKEKSEEKGISK